MSSLPKNYINFVFDTSFLTFDLPHTDLLILINPHRFNMFKRTVLVPNVAVSSSDIVGK